VLRGVFWRIEECWGGGILAVLGVLGGVFWRFKECWGECFGGFKSVRGSVLEF